MLKDHKYFHFKPFSDEINDLIFFKSPKALFGTGVDLFGVFFPKFWFFPNNEALSQLSSYGSNFMYNI